MKYLVFAKKKGEWVLMEDFKKKDQAEVYSRNLKNMYPEIKIEERI